MDATNATPAPGRTGEPARDPDPRRDDAAGASRGIGGQNRAPGGDDADRQANLTATDDTGDTLPIAYVRHKSAPVHAVESISWLACAAKLSVPQVGAKDGTGWMPVVIEPGPRLGERVKLVTALVLDIEAATKADPETHVKTVIGPEPPTPSDCAAEIGLLGWSAFVHTSHGHLDPAILPADEAHPRYRLVMRLSRPLTGAEIRPLGLHVLALLGLGDCADLGCLEPARLFYLPRVPAERLDLFEYHVIEGDPLPVDALLAEAQRETAAARERPTHPPRTGSVIQAFNAAHDIGALLESRGYIRTGRGRWLHPESTTGAPGVRLLPDTDPPRIYSSHGCCPLSDGHAHDAFSIYAVLVHGGDQRAAVKAAADLLGIGPGPRNEPRNGPSDPGPGMGGDPGPWGAAEAPGDFPNDDGIRPLHGKRDTVEPVASLIKVPMDSMMAHRPPPRFAVDGYFPRGLVTLLGAHGGAGKSILALIWAALVACGAAFAGHGAICGRALFVSLEDGADMVLDRLRKIVVAYGLDQDAVMTNVAVLDGSTGNCALAVEQAYGKRLTATPLMAEIRAAADGCALVIIDNASDAFVGNENDRSQVRAFMRMLGEIARSSGAAVLLLAHIDKNAAKYGAQGNSYSGSTAWHNSARSRLALTDKDGLIELAQEKLTVARKCAPLTLAWTDAGVLVPAAGGTGTGTLLTDAADVLAAIRAAESAGVNVGTGRTGPATTQHVLSTMAELPGTLRGPRGRDRFWRALGHLLAAGTIKQESYRTHDSKTRQRLSAGSVSALGSGRGASAGSGFSPLPPYPPTELAEGPPIGEGSESVGTGGNWRNPVVPDNDPGADADSEAF